MTADLPYIAIRNERSATAKGAPVLLIHGVMSSAESDFPRDRWADALLAQGRDVIHLDLPGHGSSRRVGSVDEGRTGAIVAAIARALGTTPVDVVAYSLGARIAWAFAARHPELVNRLVLGGLAPMEPFALLDFPAARKFVDDGTRPADAMTGFLAGMFASRGDGHSMLNLAEGLAAEPFVPGAEAPSAPTLLMAGADDQMAGGIAALEAHLKGARTVRVPGDHMAALASDAFRQNAFSFLGLTA